MTYVINKPFFELAYRKNAENTCVYFNEGSEIQIEKKNQIFIILAVLCRIL